MFLAAKVRDTNGEFPIKGYWTAEVFMPSS
jgi:hypothetical protein